MPPTIILVHGAFADSSSWNDVVEPLQDAGHPVIAVANPLRSVAADAAAVTDVVRSIDGPVVLVGHSYGGAVISNVAADAGEITGLVFIAAFAPDYGENANTLATKFEGSTLPQALRPVPRSDGTTDLYIRNEAFHAQFAADLPKEQTTRMAVTQRPVTLEALNEPTGERPLWKQVPSYFLVAGQDRNIPAELQRFMAERAGARRMLEIPRASHAAGVSQSQATARLILEAAAVPVAA
jgi:pimeloyl-ACP methyl ester carboxylesterase